MSPTIDDDERPCKPDFLKITVGDALEDGTGAVKDYYYHSITMAGHSNYIDTMLASGMKESNTHEISFPDIAPATWDSMMKFLDDPLAIRLMTVQDVMEVAPWYDKYVFLKGRELSGHILTEYISKGMPIFEDIDIFLDAILLVDALNLDEAKNAGVDWIRRAMLSHPFSRDHIVKLVPLFAKEDSLFATVKRFVKSVVTKDDILHRLFPELLIAQLASAKTKHAMIRELVDGVTLSGSGCEADGKYNVHVSNDTDTLVFTQHDGDTNAFYKIIMIDDMWVIVLDEGDGEMIIWKCLHSRTMMFPPRDGWVLCVDEFPGENHPTLEYLRIQPCRMHPQYY
jgi:hypothetical protein